MIVRDLVWANDAGSARLRVARFTRRVPVQMETIAAVANTMAQRLSELVGEPVRLDVFPPVIVSADAWELLCADAYVYEIAGERSDAALLCSKNAARHIVQHAFGEDTQPMLST
ncbi:MAG: hypothetical protein ACREJX_15125, partial [Polyangiaceae bacterium]